MKHEVIPRSAEDADYAPDNFAQFVSGRLGDGVVRQIEFAFGGRRINLTSEPKDHQALAKVIGIENAKIIAIEFGYGLVDIPLGSASRSARIEQACLTGGTITEIARSLGCSSRTVSKARARLRRKGLL